MMRRSTMFLRIPAIAAHTDRAPRSLHALPDFYPGKGQGYLGESNVALAPVHHRANGTESALSTKSMSSDMPMAPPSPASAFRWWYMQATPQHTLPVMFDWCRSAQWMAQSRLDGGRPTSD
jgi:hypothetical protein